MKWPPQLDPVASRGGHFYNHRRIDKMGWMYG
jgi:hypothetical protein